MEAAVFAGVATLEIRDVEEPQVQGEHDVKVRVLACGICGTDLHILSDPPGHPAGDNVVLGHEFMGEVAEVGSAVTTVSPGQHVAVRPIVTCGSCKWCLSGHPNHCINMEIWGVFRDGGLAEFAVVPDTACIPIDSSIPVEVAALTEPLACVLSGVKKATLVPGETVVVLGAGAIGLLFTALFKAAGASKIAVVEIVEARAQVARQLGADLIIDPTKSDVATVVAQHFGDGPDVVVDAVGSQLTTAINIAAKLARIILFGLNSHARAEVAQFQITEKELSLIGSFVGQQNFPDAIRLIESGTIDFAAIVSHIVPLAELAERLPELRGGSVIKAIVTTGSSR